MIVTLLTGRISVDWNKEKKVKKLSVRFKNVNRSHGLSN